MIFYLFLDFIFYNYTQIKSCFFLLIFLEKKNNPFLYNFLIIVLYDFLALHTNGIFILIIFLIYLINKKVKWSYYDLIFIILRFFLLYFLYQILIYLFLSKFTFNIYGFVLTLFCLIISAKLKNNS